MKVGLLHMRNCQDLRAEKTDVCFRKVVSLSNEKKVENNQNICVRIERV